MRSFRAAVGLLIGMGTSGCASTVRRNVTPWLRTVSTSQPTLFAESGTHSTAVVERYQGGRWEVVEGAQISGFVVQDGRGVVLDWTAADRATATDAGHIVHERHLLSQNGSSVVFRTSGDLRLSPENELLDIDLFGSEPPPPQAWTARIIRFNLNGREADRRELALPMQPEEAGRGSYPRFVGFLAERLVFVVEFAHAREGWETSLRDPCVAYALDAHGGWHLLGEQPPGVGARERCEDAGAWRRVLGVPITPGLGSRNLDLPRP